MIRHDAPMITARERRDICRRHGDWNHSRFIRLCLCGTPTGYDQLVERDRISERHRGLRTGRTAGSGIGYL